MKRPWAAFLIVLAAAGCVDSADSISREYRNLNNEAIDGLMMVTSERRARTAVERVLAEYENKLKTIEGKVKNFELNNEKIDALKQMYNSDSMAILSLEMSFNKQRLDAEERRLQELYRSLKAEQPDAELKYLEMLVKSREKTSKVREQLNKNKLTDLFAKLAADPKLRKEGKDAEVLDRMSKAYTEKVEQFKSSYPPAIPLP